MSEITPKPNVNIYKHIPGVERRRAKSSSPLPTSAQADTAPGIQDFTTCIEKKYVQLENPAKGSGRANERAAKRNRQQKDSAARRAGIISRAEAKKTGVWKIDKRIAKYTAFIPIHLMWCAYMAELMGLPLKPALGQDGKLPEVRMPNAEGMQAKLVRADLNGSIIKVKQSRNTSIIGCQGIVIHETENTFKLVTKKNALKVIPKENTIFSISLPLYAPPLFDPTTLFSEVRPVEAVATEVSSSTDVGPVLSSEMFGPISLLDSPLEREPSIGFDLYGNQFRFRAADRASRKFKSKKTIEL